MTTKLEGVDVFGDKWEVRPVDANRRFARRGGVAIVETEASGHAVTTVLDGPSAAKLGAFLLAASDLGKDALAELDMVASNDMFRHVVLQRILRDMPALQRLLGALVEAGR